MASDAPLLSVAAELPEEPAHEKILLEEGRGNNRLRSTGQGLVLVTAMLMKSFMGAASFEFPGALQSAGFWTGIISTIIFAAMAAYTLILFQKIRELADSTVKEPSYAQLGFIAFGRLGSVLVTAAVIAMTIGVCSSYLVFTGQVTSQMIQFYGNSSNFENTTTSGEEPGVVVPWMVNFQQWMGLLATVPFVMILSIVKDISKLSVTSVIGTITIVACMVIIVAKRFTEASISIEAWDKVLATKPSFNGFSHYIGNAAFIFCIHSVGVPIERSVKNPRHYPTAVVISTAAVALINLAFGLLCWILYEETGVTSDIVSEIDPNSIFLLIIEIALCLVMILTYALFLYPLADVAQRWFSTSFNTCQLTLFRWLLVAITVAFALPFVIFSGQSDFSLVTNLTGGVANTMVGIILPSVIYMKLWTRVRGPNATRGQWITVLLGNCAVAVAGVGIVILSTYATVVP